MTRQHAGEPLGERMIVGGCWTEDGRRVANTLVEIWQANAAGRYLHGWDQQQAPREANFTRCGQAVPTRRGGQRSRLCSQPGGAGEAETLEWNVILQGAEETVFFDLGR